MNLIFLLKNKTKSGIFLWPFSLTVTSCTSNLLEVHDWMSAIFTRCPGDTYKLGPERLTRLGNSNVPRLLVTWAKKLLQFIVDSTQNKLLHKSAQIYLCRIPEFCAKINFSDTNVYIFCVKQWKMQNLHRTKMCPVK